MLQRVFAGFLTFICTIGAAPSWQLIKNKKGIKVYRQATPGQSLLRFKGTGVIDKEVFYILAVFADVERTPEWVESVKKVKVLKQVSDTEMITYSVARAPWPLKDRDTVARGTVKFDAKNRWVHIISRAIEYPAKPPVDKYVRVPEMQARWSFKPLKGKKTWVEFSVRVDPGGMIPDWVVNWVSENVPFNSIVNLRKRIKNGKFNHQFVEKNRHYLEKW